MNKSSNSPGISVLALVFLALLATSSHAAPSRRPLILAHYLPWYTADYKAGKWGWHWTMNHFDPNKMVNGRREIASHYYPLIGPYDSADPDLAECDALLMKYAGFDGAVLDWNGTDDYYDYASNNRGDEVMAAALRRAGLRYAILYEDNSVRELVKGGRLAPADAVSHGQKTLLWLQTHWFSSPSYISLNGRPLFLVWGGNGGYYQGAQWTQIFSALPQEPAYFSELGRNEPAIGGFGWPQPTGGTAASAAALETFYGWYSHTSNFIAVAYPRFDDIYADAGVHPSWGHIDDLDGKTYTDTLSRALTSGAPAVQIATWNDWGEGTQIEPSVEFGYRDLEATQRLRKKYVDPVFPYTPADLRLPIKLYLLRKAHPGDSAMQKQLDKVADLLCAGKPAPARALLAKLEGH